MSVHSAQSENQLCLSTAAVSVNRVARPCAMDFFYAPDSFLCGASTDIKLDQLRNQFVSYPEVVLRRYDSLGQNTQKAISPQNTKLIILPTVIALKYAFTMVMF